MPELSRFSVEQGLPLNDETIPVGEGVKKGSLQNVMVLTYLIIFVMQKRKVGGASPSQIPLTRRFWQYLLQREVSLTLSCYSTLC